MELISDEVGRLPPAPVIILYPFDSGVEKPHQRRVVRCPVVHDDPSGRQGSIEMDVNNLGVAVRHDAHGPATDALSRGGLDRLADDPFHALTDLNSENIPNSNREYVEMTVRINVCAGRYFAHRVGRGRCA